MLSAAENELLTRIGPGSPMGSLLRRYWLPGLLSEELPEPDGTPIRFRLLGEDLVAFRDSSGAVGVLEEGCPHRRASLALGRNEEAGLRCIYHGWKFDRGGVCLETPTEPEGSGYRDKVRAVAYPAEEMGGAVWVYMGPDGPPRFPGFQWLTQPRGRSQEFKMLEECNFAQAIEGGLDEAHTPVLHRRAPWNVLNDSTRLFLRAQDLSPRLEVEPARYGFRYAALRRMEGGSVQVRITPFIFPFWTVVAPNAFRHEGDRMVNAWAPRDDYSTWHFQWFFNTEQPVDVEWRMRMGGHWVDKGNSYRKHANKDNWYLQDREAMQTVSMSGIDGIVPQDHAMNESQGPILDRTREHLATSDVGIIAMRKALLDAVRAYGEGREPPGLDLAFEAITSQTLDLQEGVRWQEASPLGEQFAPGG